MCLIEIAGKYIGLLRPKVSVQNNTNPASDLNRAKPMPVLSAEFFTRLSMHPVVCMVLALFSSTAAFKAFCGINASVQLLRIAFLLEIFSVDGLTLHLPVIARNVLLFWSMVFLFVFAACAIAWVRDQQESGRSRYYEVQSCDVDSTRLRAKS